MSIRCNRPPIGQLTVPPSVGIGLEDDAWLRVICIHQITHKQSGLEVLHFVLGIAVLGGGKVHLVPHGNTSFPFPRPQSVAGVVAVGMRFELWRTLPVSASIMMSIIAGRSASLMGTLEYQITWSLSAEKRKGGTGKRERA